VLREHGADIEAKEKYGNNTPLHFACYCGRLAVVVELLGPNDRDGATTIFGKRKSCGGAEIQAKDSNDWTPLHLAYWQGHLAIVKALVSGGADILAANNEGRLPVHCAVTLGFSEVAKYLLQHIYATIRRLPLHELVEDLTWIGDPTINDAPPLREALDDNVLGTDDVVEILEYVVDQNPDSLASCDPDGALPLHLACRRGASFPIVQSLVNFNKASVKSVTCQGDLPIFLACEMSEPSLDS
jgi:ankyrin repeat protein